MARKQVGNARARAQGQGRRQKSRRRSASSAQEQVDYVDYKDVNLLRRFMSDRAKIRARRVTGNDAQQQRDVAHGDQERPRDGAAALRQPRHAAARRRRRRSRSRRSVAATDRAPRARPSTPPARGR